MTTVTQRASPPEASGGARPSRLLVVIVGIVAAALGLGAGYLLFAPSAADGGNAEVEALLDEWWDAVEADDAEAILRLMPDGGTWGSVDVMFAGTNLGQVAPATAERTVAASLARNSDTPSGDPVVVGEYGAFEVAQPATSATGEERLFVLKIGTEGEDLILYYVDVL